ncbi:S-layer homology domain-containing protein [Paenibacillus sp. J22TS3]|uniref:S-layer homology domain-containing protein n=1 Tax=Paenibacillus sp. J22TS3 TaxID=2807192 RepID=UPI001B23E6B8|nr:S-layer homology domain-containing protein [Paenibacillus sp. J22TS3]GIP23794.1 hypothetical protein J22TS3_40690 [Paenibacillus sp. J22TS3]
MKKIVYSAAAALLLTLSVPSLTHAKTSADFVDLKDLDAATKAKFDALISSGIFDGLGDSRFGLNDAMTRAQFAKVAALILNLKVDTSLKNSSFKDVKPDDFASGYALPYIEALKQAGITNGDGKADTFNPGGPVTKEQLAAFLVRVLGLDVKNEHLSIKGTVSDWAAGYVGLAVRLELLKQQANMNWTGTANRNDLVLSSYETKTQLDPLQLLSASVTEQHELNLTFSASLQPSQVDLSKILINGKPLDKIKAQFRLSTNGKVLTIIFDGPLSQDLLNQPAVSIDGLQSLTGKTLKTDKPVTIEKGNLLPAPPVVPPSNTGSTGSTYTPPSSGGGYTPPSDTTAPQLLSIKRKGSESIVLLSFSEALSDTSAINLSSYKLVKDSASSTNLPEASTAVLSGDKKQVTLTFPQTFSIGNRLYSVPSFFTGDAGIQVSGVTDLAGNVISPIVRKVEVENPGLNSTVSFVKPSVEEGNWNKTQPKIGEHPEGTAFKYQVAAEPVSAIIGLAYNSDENGTLGWNSGEEGDILSEANPISIVNSRNVITVISYNTATKEVIGYQSFKISEDQVVRSKGLSKEITIELSDNQQHPGMYKVSFESLPEGHVYYYLNTMKNAEIGKKKSESFEWADAWALTSGTEIQATEKKLTVIETDKDGVILAYEYFDPAKFPEDPAK